ncbi:MAG: DUF1828 domain-containing protein [Chloroflexota bacterium]
MDKCEELKEQVKKFLADGVKVRPIKDDGCLLQIPFRDSDGDPLRIVVYKAGDSIILNDAGAIAGHLFTLGQHTQDTPAFRLLRSLERAYGLELDFDNGRVTTTVLENQMSDAIMDFSKVILTMVTAIPHIRVEPHRLKPLGQRLKAKIKDQYKQANILDLVEHDYSLPGETVESWPIDFHWWLKRDDHIEQIYIVTVDLNVAEALQKAAKVSILALDARRIPPYDKLRVVLDSHGENSNAKIATSLMKNHSKKLQYNVYDFGQDEDRRTFISQSVDEITGRLGESWRDFWRKQQALT